MRKIKGFENYEISEAGAVINTKTGREIRPSLNENGYLYFSLWKNNKAYTQTAHRLVALTYIPNFANKPFVNHIDADRSNPHKSNLEWCTQSENIKHAYRIGNMSQKKNFDVEELDWILDEFFKNQTMTSLAQKLNVGLSRLTINLRNRAIKLGKGDEFTQLLIAQKSVRNAQASVKRRIEIIQLDKEGNELARFPSLTAATRALGKGTCGPISNTLNPLNPQKIGYGFQWKYA